MGRVGIRSEKRREPLDRENWTPGMSVLGLLAVSLATDIVREQPIMQQSRLYFSESVKT